MGAKSGSLMTRAGASEGMPPRLGGGSADFAARDAGRGKATPPPPASATLADAATRRPSNGGGKEEGAEAGGACCLDAASKPRGSSPSGTGRGADALTSGGSGATAAGGGASSGAGELSGRAAERLLALVEGREPAAAQAAVGLRPLLAGREFARPMPVAGRELAAGCSCCAAASSAAGERTAEGRLIGFVRGDDVEARASPVQGRCPKPMSPTVWRSASWPLEESSTCSGVKRPRLSRKSSR